MLVVDNCANFLVEVGCPFSLLCPIIKELVDTFGTSVVNPVVVGRIHIVKMCKQVLYLHAC